MTRARPRFALLLVLGLALPASAGTLLTLTKTDSPDPVAAGGQVTYTVNFANIGNTAATNVRLRDPVPTNTTFGSASCNVGTGCALNNGVVACVIGTLAASAGGTCTIVVNVNLPLPDGTILSDVATITDNEGESVDAGASTVVSSSPNLALSNVDAPDPVLASDLLVNTVTLTNTGNETATGVTITHTIDANTSFVSANCTPVGSVCAPGAGTVTCTVGAIVAPAGTLTCTLVTQVGFPLAEATIVQQCADASSNQAATVEACTQTTVNAANLTLGIAPDHDPIVPGEELHYRIRFANRRLTDATQVAIVATLPIGTTIRAASDGGTDLGNGQAQWVLGTLPAGASGAVDLILDTEPSLATPGLLVMVAVIRDAEGDSTEATETGTAAAAAPLTMVISDGPDPVAAGATLTSTIRVGNRGTNAATGLIVTIPDPARNTITSIAPVPAANPNPCVHSAVNRNTVCTLGGLGVTEVKTIQVVTTTNAGQPIGSLSQLGATAADAAGDQATAVAFTLIDGTNTIALTKTADFDPVQVGSSLTYTLRYTTSASGAVTISDALPKDAAYASAICDAPTSTCACDTATCDATSSLVRCTIPDPAPASGSCTVVVAGVVGKGELILNPGLATAGGHSAEAIATTLAVANQPLSKLIASDYPDPVPVTFRGAPGQLTYSIHYQNVGNDLLKGVIVKGKTPTGTLFVSASAPLDPGVRRQPVPGKRATVQWKVGDLAPGEGGDLTLVVSLRPSLRMGRVIRNVFTMKTTNAFADQVRVFTTVGPAK